MSVGILSELIRKSQRHLPLSLDGLEDAQAAPSVGGKQVDESALLSFFKGLNGQVCQPYIPNLYLSHILDQIRSNVAYLCL